MAVFLLNICKFNGCGITFPSLGDLIQHIEDTHIDYDPKVVEQKEQAQPACLPLSYVLRFISDDARKESPFLSANAAGAELKRKLAIKHHSYSMSSSNRSNTPTGSEMDEDEMVVSESEDSNDSWTTEEFSSEFIMRYGSRHSGSGSNGTPGNEKPFACPVPGCKKRYKNVNGIKYHSKNGHKKDGKVRKGYKCHCGKSYKTAQGLKSHALVAHNSSPENVLVTQTLGNVLSTGNGSGGGGALGGGGGVLMQRSTSPSQSLGSLSPSSISNMSSGASSCHGSGGLNGNASTGTGNGNCSQNLLQHFSNNSSHGSQGQTTTVNCLAQAINGGGNGVSGGSVGGGTLNLQQQQYTTTANNHQQVVAAGAGAATPSSASSILATTVATSANVAAAAGVVNNVSASSTESSSTQFSFSGQLLPTATQQQQRCNVPSSLNAGGVGAGAGAGAGGGSGGCLNAGLSNNGNCFYAATAPIMPTKSLLPSFGSSAANNGPQLPTNLQQQQQQHHHQPPAISPTFIEHKYSANTFKEKFLANLRQNQQNNKLKTLNLPITTTTPIITPPTVTAAAAAAVNTVAPTLIDNNRILIDNGSINNCETSNSLETIIIDDDDDDDDDEEDVDEEDDEVFNVAEGQDNINEKHNNNRLKGNMTANVNGLCGVSAASLYITNNVGGSSGGVGIGAGVVEVNNANPEKCSIQQQLNETIKNNLYKKSIN
uniref:C2H2-type domain-containing protein n=1 Tax=Stomoxys calcitrans TaxID=35570 RepID=A0A1I8QF09_STOCA